MNTREAVELVAPSGKALRVFTYLTARELRELRLTINRYIELPTSKSDLAEMKSLKVDHVAAEKEEQDLLIKYAIESYDGSSEDILDRLLDGPDAKDFDFALEKAKELRQNPIGPRN